MFYFVKLENALKRANEFIDVGKKTRALECLCDAIRSRKHRQWQKKHEDIMMKYLELCVELKLSWVAKEGIYQYKTICQQTYIKSFEDIVRSYLAMAEAEAETAREKSQAAAIDDVDDLDNIQTPESLLMKAVCTDADQDRTDRVVLVPRIKFLWESYRACLDILRNNPRTERLYHDIAHQAFQFCIKYNRKTEFRRLCESLHTHLDTLKRLQIQLTQPGSHQPPNYINLNNPESQAMHLETRLMQLDSAIKMELWQEAYKATDDIKKFGLMNVSKKLPKPQLMADYYKKLSLVFWKANNPLFHAAALFKLFTLNKELRKNITQEDVQKMASRVVTATLAIPIPPSRPEIEKLVETEENVIESHQRSLASLLNLTAATPTRSSLISDLKRMGVLQHAYQPLQDLYYWLEVEFHPLNLCKKIEEGIKYLENCENCPELAQYISALKDVTVVRLLKEISQVYQSIEYKRVLELCPFVNKIYLEKMVVSAARRNDLQVRIDHRNECLYFGIESRMSTNEEVIEGPHLQSMPSEQIRQQLVTMYSVLLKARSMMESDQIKREREQTKRNVMVTYEANKEADHRALLARPDYIERRKEEIEQLSVEREKKERELLEEKQRELRLAEEERLAKEAEERARERKLQEDEELKKRMALDQIEKIRQTEGGLKLLDGMTDDDIVKLKLEDIKSRQLQQLEKERSDQQQRQRNLERKIDHIERAKRQEEIPLLIKAYEEWSKQDQKEWHESEADRIRSLEFDRQQAVENKERLMRMQPDKEKFVKEIQDMRRKIYQEAYEQWKSTFDEEKAQKLRERKEQRKVERRETYYRQKKEAEERKKAEEERKRKQAEEEERRKEYERTLAKQRQKEKEIEEKMRAKNDEILGGKDKDIAQEPIIEKPLAKADQEDDWRRPQVKDERSDRTDRPKYIPPSARNRDMPKDGPRDGYREGPRDYRESTREISRDDGGNWRNDGRNLDSGKPRLPYKRDQGDRSERSDRADYARPRMGGPPRDNNEGKRDFSDLRRGPRTVNKTPDESNEPPKAYSRARSTWKEES